MMTDEELGLDTFITRDGSGANKITVESISGEETVVQLNPKLLSYQSAIMCQGTLYGSPTELLKSLRDAIKAHRPNQKQCYAGHEKRNAMVVMIIMDKIVGCEVPFFTVPTWQSSG
ncbi:hypothetical protein BDDG_13311 [Blastomyces dermatitidis ATCC 18188]|nr:hypothetical protein BDDG_13311 [Blastomyces dermatitidis ATCC 18188]